MKSKNGTVICFAQGTAIHTIRGLRPVEDLRPGDRVITRDNGIRDVAWIGQRTLSAQDLREQPRSRPVLIRKGVFGDGLPERDTLVSPRHRILITSSNTAVTLGDSEVFCCAEYLTVATGIDWVDVPDITYFHVMFEYHEVILSNGIWTESFQPSDSSLRGICVDQRREVLSIFPDLETPAGLGAYGSARKSLRRIEAAAVALRAGN